MAGELTLGDGVLTIAVGALAVVVKWLIGRSDRALESRDKQVFAQQDAIQLALSQLTEAQRLARQYLVEFQSFKEEEHRVHAVIDVNDRKIMTTLEEQALRLDRHEGLLNGIAATQERTAELLGKMIDKMGART